MNKLNITTDFALEPGRQVIQCHCNHRRDLNVCNTKRTLLACGSHTRHDKQRNAVQTATVTEVFLHTLDGHMHRRAPAHDASDRKE